MWKAKKQTGEMAYGQPNFYVVATHEEYWKAKRELDEYHKGQLLIHIHRYFNTTSSPEDGSSKSEECFDKKFVSLYLGFCRKKGRLPSEENRGSVRHENKTYIWSGLTPTSSISDAVLWSYIEPSETNPVQDTIWMIRIQPQCFKDVEAAANYFGDRLPKAFYERYAEGTYPIISKQ